jgi:hypothetical protein
VKELYLRERKPCQLCCVALAGFCEIDDPCRYAIALLRAGAQVKFRADDDESCVTCNYDDVCDTIRAFMGRGVIIRTVINGMTFDGATTDPIAKAVRDALIAFMAATAQGASRSDQGRSEGRNRARQGPHRLAVPRPQAGVHAVAVRCGSRDARQGDD